MINISNLKHLFLLLLNNLLHKKYLYAALLHVGAYNGQNSRNSISILTICYLIVSCQPGTAGLAGNIIILHDIYCQN